MTGPPVTTFADLLAASASRIVLLDAAGAVTGQVSPSEVLAAGRTIAAALGERGVKPDDRIGLWMQNGLRYLEMLAACASGGFVAVSVNTRYGEAEAHELLTRSGASHVAVDDDTRDRLPPSTAITAVDTVEHTSVFAGAATSVEPTAGGPDSPFLVFTTSGTTSRPKMVLHRQRSIAVHAGDVARSLPVRPDDVAYIAMPLCGVFGLTSLTSALAGGATILLPPQFEASASARAIAEHRVSMVHGSDDMFHRLVEADADLSSIRCGGYGRFNTSLDGIAERCDERGARLMGLYGMSEVQALFAGRDASLDLAERTRAGGRLLSPHAHHRIVDGELQLKGPSLFAGYLNEGGGGVDEALTASAHVRGWFRTGDLAETDADRSFTYVARMGDAMRLGGFLVAPAEIEAVLIEIDGVEEAQVVEVDRPTGARPVAFVIAPGGVDEQAAIAHCQGRLARYKAPVRVVAIDEFPATQSANGTKIQKAKLRALADDLLPG